MTAFAICLTGCQSAPPLTREHFADASERCGLEATTYTYRDGFLTDEPLVDFTNEQNSTESYECFADALDKIDREMTESGVTHFSRIWEYRT